MNFLSSDSESYQKIAKIYKFIGIDLKKDILINSENYKTLTQEFMRNWLPAFSVVLSAVVKHHPSPCALSKERIMKLMSNDNCPFDQLPADSQLLLNGI